MQLFSPAVIRALTAVLVAGALVLTGLAFQRSRPTLTPLARAQLAGMRGIYLEDAQPMPRFDDQRPPILVAPPAEGRWTAWVVGVGQRQPLQLTVEPVDEVVRLRVQAPLPEGRWDLVLADDARLKSWPVRFTPPPVESARIAELKEQAKAEAIDARPGLWLGALKGLSGQERVTGHVEAARAWIRAGRLDEAGKQYEAAAGVASEMGWVSEQAARLRAAAWTLYRQRRFSDGLRLLEEALRLATDAEDHGGIARTSYVRACIERESGLFRDSSSSLQLALLESVRTNDRRLEEMVQDEWASLLSDLGQHQDALKLIEHLPDDASARARRLSIRGWISARRSGVEVDWLSIRGELETALEGLVEPDARYIALCNLMEVDLLSGDTKRASERLAALSKMKGEFARGHVRLFRAELLLKTDELTAAGRLFEEGLAAAERELEYELGWRAAIGVARAKSRLGDDNEVLRYVQVALRNAEQLGRSSAVSSSRATWMTDRSALMSDAVDLNLRLARPTDALLTLDATRAWVVRDLEARLRVERLKGAAREQWLKAQGEYLKTREAFESAITNCQRRPADERPTCEARLRTQRATVEQRFDDLYAVLDTHAPSALTDVKLPTLSPGEALFTATRLKDRTVGFWLAGDTVHARTIDPAQPLAPFAAEAAQATHLYIVAGGGLTPAQVLADPRAQAKKTLTWSELPFAGLLTRPTAQADAPPVVIADPALDLQHAAEEGIAVQAQVGGRLLQGDAAHRDAVTEALQSGARLLHFAGHGALDAESPWQAHLVLADEARLTLADLLVAAPRVGLVVLSGCQTGVRQALSRQHAVGLTDAFLLAGAHAVIATDRVIPDDQARAFIDLFYQSPDWARRPAAAYAAAIRALRAAGNPIWSAFRYLGRA